MNITEIRNKLGMTKTQFANAIGVGYQTVNLWEKGKASPDKDNTQKINNLLCGKPNLSVNVKRLSDKAKIPTKGSRYAAGYDLYACIDESIQINPHTTTKIGTGLAIEIPVGYFGAIVARSGLASKLGIRPANCIGICDSDYRGEYIVALHNDSDNPVVINPGERIAQLVIMPFLAVSFDEVTELTETDRGEGGFGSTGK